MNPNPEAAARTGWMEASGLTYLLQTFKLAAKPTKIAIALVAILLTLIWGMALDGIWTASGRGADPLAISKYLGRTTTAVGGTNHGIFAVFSQFELDCIRDAIESVRYGRLLGPVQAGEPVAVAPGQSVVHPVRGAFANVVLMGRGLAWLITDHFFYAVLMLVVLILIWAVAGGMICRMTAMQFARDEAISVKDAFSFTREKLLGGFFSAPLIPLAMCFFIGLFMALGGLFLRIPALGDTLGGLLFFLALIGGGLVALILAGCVAGGSFFWPTVAVEGSDSFDAISRSFNYVYARPLRALWYAGLAVVYGSFCWLFVRFMIWLLLASTHVLVDFGSGGKLSDLWMPPTFEWLYRISPEAGGGWKWMAAGLIGLWILPVVGAAWAFLATFYFSGSTIVYFLLRRDVDDAELTEIYMPEKEPLDPPSPPTASLPAKSEPARTPAPAAKDEESSAAPETHSTPTEPKDDAS